jgi:hypothetical protein
MREKEKKTIIQLLIEVCLIVGFLSSISYLGKEVVRKIPYPLDGYYGFKHADFKDVQNISLLGSYIIMFSSILQNRILTLKKKLNI